MNNGVEMPLIGFGTYQMPARITARCVGEALEIGYRHVDTAQCYYNEREVGAAIKNSDLPREKIFVTKKLWSCRGYRDTLNSIENSLRALNIGYIDLLLIHEPTGNFNEIYRAMEKKYLEGALRAIGVANFLEENFNRLMKKFGTIHESWSPLACGKNEIFSNETLKKIAEAHGKTVAQIALRFLYQQGIPIIPKSTHAERMRENFSITNFELTAAEISSIRQLDKGKSLFSWW